MRPHPLFLTSRFGRRLFLLFASCALLPIAGLALISYVSVHRELTEQAEARLAATGKSLAMGVWERLAVLDAELQIIASRLEPGSGPGVIAARSVLGEQLSNRFRGIQVRGVDSGTVARWGVTVEVPELTPEEQTHMASGRPLMRVAANGRRGPRILLGRESRSPGETPVVIWSEIEPLYLWWGAGLESTLPAGHELVVLDGGSPQRLFSTLPDAVSLPEDTETEARSGSHGALAWQIDAKSFIGNFRLMNLRPAFSHRGLIVVVSEPEELVALPLVSFKRAFLFVVLATLIVVALASLRQIRASLVPLEKLREGTRKIADGDLGRKVTVETDDEFAELAQAFNSMTVSLDRQFATLTSLNRLQQTVLSTLKIDSMVETVLDRFDRIFPCDGVSIAIMNPDRPNSGLIYREKASAGPARVELLELKPQEMAALYAQRQRLEIDLARGVPSFMPVTAGADSKVVFAFPAFLNNELAAIVAAGCSDRADLREGDFQAARQVTDQVAIGLTNTRLVHELDNLNWGTLSALARAVDVRSSWTMGHTERVTKLARDLGRSMGLSKQRLDTLHRGGLLHDIGKLGIAQSVLDKPGPLTEEERVEVQEHVHLGVRIIEPIPALADVIPIVLQHHEWWDGSGYPVGLAGEEICLEARILSVADCYDALSSDRPYREAFLHDQAMEMVVNGAGTQFDPQVVDAFIRYMKESYATLFGESAADLSESRAI